MNEKNITNIKINEILPNRLQPRIVFQDEQIDELAESIKKYGVINPITVRKLGDKYEIIAGERRFKASKSIGLEEIPAFVIEADDKASAELALIENIQRKDLSPIEEGLSYDKILKISEITQEELSKRLGKKQSTIANKIRLLKLDDSVKDALLNEQISERHARALLKLYDKENQKELLKRIIEERLTVRQTDEEIGKIIEQKGGIIEMNKNIEMPSSTMIEDKTEENIIEPTLVNPSFVDVNKIENESKDIFVEKPGVNIEDLLKSVPKNEEIGKVEVPNEQTKNENDKKLDNNADHGMPTPKFFNFFPPQEENMYVQEPSVQESINESETEQSTGGFAFESISNPVVEDQTDKAVVPVDGFSFDAISSMQNEEVQPVQEPNSSFAFESIINQPVEEQEEQELPEMKESKIEESVSPQYNFQNFNPIIHNDFVEAPVEEELELIEEEEEETPKPQIQTNSPKQMKDVIRVIRDCNDVIESYGYKIETEEFDLETMYQVIFKIFKN